MSDRPLDAFNCSDEFVDNLAPIVHDGGMVWLTFARHRPSYNGAHENIAVANIVMTRERYEAMRRQIAADKGMTLAATSALASEHDCAGSA